MANRSKKSGYADIYEEGTQAYEKTHVDLVGLNHALDVMKRLKKGKGFIGPQAEWFDGVCSSYKIPLIHNPSQRLLDKKAIKQAKDARKILQPTAKALTKILALVERELEMCEENLEAFANRAGFFILPDEVLSTILEYAALRDHLDDDEYTPRYPRPAKDKHPIANTVKAATRLSHVCKRFRNLIIHSSGLWNRVQNTMDNAGMVSTCLSRCRRANAEVTLSTPLFESRFARFTKPSRMNELFIQTVIENAERVRSFNLKGEGDDFEDSPSGVESLQDFSNLAKEVDFPNLASLSVHYPKGSLKLSEAESKRFQVAIQFFRSWLTPKLHSLSVTNFVPLPFSGAPSLTFLHLNLDFDGYGWRRKEHIIDAMTLVSFLELSSNLENFTFSLASASESTIPSQSRNAIVMPRLNRVNFCFNRCTEESLKPFFDAMDFKHVTEMKLRISSSNETEKVHGTLFEDIFLAVIPNAEAFPKLISLSLSVRVTEVWEGDGDYLCDTFPIPFASIPHLKHLDLLSISSKINPISEGIVLPALRTLSIYGSYKIKEDWLVGFLKQMDRQGHLGTLRVSVEDGCSRLNRCGLNGALSKEDIQRLVAAEDSE